jgi:dipicolinate synthase subunit A
MIMVLAFSAEDARRLATGPEPAVGSRKRSRSFRLVSRFWRDLEIVLRWIFLDAQERKTHPLSSRIRAPKRDAPEPIEAGIPAPPASAERVSPHPEPPPSKPRRNVLVAGRAKFTDGLLRCLLSEDVNVHAIAVDRDEARDLIIMGATPHALEDIPDQAAQFDLVLSTDLMQFIGAEALERLPEHAVIVDLAPPPGSVDYESAKKLGRKAIWTRSAISEGRSVFCPATWGKIRHVLEFCRHGA